MINLQIYTGVREFVWNIAVTLSKLTSFILGDLTLPNMCYGPFLTIFWDFDI